MSGPGERRDDPALWVGVERDGSGISRGDHQCDPDRCIDSHRYPDGMPAYNMRDVAAAATVGERRDLDAAFIEHLVSLHGERIREMMKSPMDSPAYKHFVAGARAATPPKADPALRGELLDAVRRGLFGECNVTDAVLRVLADHGLIAREGRE